MPRQAATSRFWLRNAWTEERLGGQASGWRCHGSGGRTGPAPPAVAPASAPVAASMAAAHSPRLGPGSGHPSPRSCSTARPPSRGTSGLRAPVENHPNLGMTVRQGVSTEARRPPTCGHRWAALAARRAMVLGAARGGRSFAGGVTPGAEIGPFHPDDGGRSPALRERTARPPRWRDDGASKRGQTARSTGPRAVVRPQVPPDPCPNPVTRPTAASCARSVALRWRGRRAGLAGAR